MNEQLMSIQDTLLNITTNHYLLAVVVLSPELQQNIG